MEVTLPPNQSTSPYAIKMMVKFLKMVYIGIGKYCNAFDPVYIMPTKKTTIGYHFLAASYFISWYLIKFKNLKVCKNITVTKL